MMRTARAARVTIAAFALALLIPIFGIGRQAEHELQLFHNRTLREWPATADFVANPTAYLGALKGWLADRVYPIVDASTALKKLMFFVLRTAPQRRLSLAADGFIFLNGGSEDGINGILEQGCVGAHTQPTAQALARGLDGFGRYGRALGAKVDVVVVPTLATVYADRLPASVPAPLRRACMLRMQGESPLQHMPVPDGVRFVYPMAQMLAARDDPAFYPRANWHPVGLSLKTVRNAYLAAIGSRQDVPETLTPTEAPSELMATYSIEYLTPVYELRNDNVVPDPMRAAAWSAGLKDLFTGEMVDSRLYVNTRPLSTESVLMLSDSFGTASGEMFAGAFASVFQITANNVTSANLVEAARRLVREHKFERVIFLIQEGSALRLVEWAEAFGGEGASQVAAPQ